jgi:hypothetical protein
MGPMDQHDLDHWVLLFYPIVSRRPNCLKTATDPIPSEFPEIGSLNRFADFELRKATESVFRHSRPIHLLRFPNSRPIWPDTLIFTELAVSVIAF